MKEDNKVESDTFKNMRVKDDYFDVDKLWGNKSREKHQAEAKAKAEKDATETKFSENGGSYATITSGIFLIVIGLFIPFGILLIIGGVIVIGNGASKLSKTNDNYKAIETEIQIEIDEDQSNSLQELLDTHLPQNLFYPKGGYSDNELIETGLYEFNSIKSCRDFYISKIDGINIRHAIVYDYKTKDIAIPLKQLSSVYELSIKDVFSQDTIFKKSKSLVPNEYKIIRTTNSFFNLQFDTYVKEEGNEVDLSEKLREVLVNLDSKLLGNVEYSYIRNRLYIKIKYKEKMFMPNDKDSNTDKFSYAPQFTHQLELLKNFIIELKSI
ncbi:hypothetical protein KQ51_00892 [Candidatus Izimaplasma bacterium HR1]|jgi:hypothetical protein|uniref:DUF3137 domain-containing protein n=1 Tax=Candidatus Izimoplasma sp. HR1 TaxID=1541959 RepID=UPI0004F7BA1B|nr:hypothetical protein KQ51_00892 [Candidatus Izimaplasma bacterium HR1]